MPRLLRSLAPLALTLVAAWLVLRATKPSTREWLDAVVPPPPALPVPPPPQVEHATGPAAAPDPVFAGWCPEPGDDDSFLVRHTLPRYVHVAARQALEEIGDAAPDAMEAAVSVRRDGTNGDLEGADAAVRRASLLSAALRLDVTSAESILRASEGLGDDAAIEVVRALAWRALDEPVREKAALRRARSLDGDDPAVALATGFATRDGADLELPIAALGTYLAAVHDAAPVARLKARLELQRDLQRDYLRTEHDGVVLLRAPGTLDEASAQRAAARLAGDLGEAARLLGGKRRETLVAVVYPAREELLAVACVRSWTGALYDGTLRIVARAGKKDGVDWSEVRHEAMHAALDRVLPDAPKWLDEGLAQAFADERGPRWRTTIETLRRERTYVPFASLEGSFQALAGGDDATVAYAQSLAMVDWMADELGARAFGDAVAVLRDDPKRNVLEALFGRDVSGEDLLAWLDRRAR